MDTIDKIAKAKEIAWKQTLETFGESVTHPGALQLGVDAAAAEAFFEVRWTDETLRLIVEEE